MKTEGEYNGALSKHLRTFWPILYHIKIADKFTLGVSDFLIWYKGESVALETKLCKEDYTDRSRVLQHGFTPPQLTVLDNFLLSGNRAFGGIFLKESRKFLLLPRIFIPPKGNWSGAEFEILKREHRMFDLWHGVKALIEEGLFGHK